MGWQLQFQPCSEPAWGAGSWAAAGAGSRQTPTPPSAWAPAPFPLLHPYLLPMTCPDLLPPEQCPLMSGTHPVLGPSFLRDVVIELQHALSLLRSNRQGLALWRVARFVAEAQVRFGTGCCPAGVQKGGIDWWVSLMSGPRCHSGFLYQLLEDDNPHKVLKTRFVKNGSERRASS